MPYIAHETNAAVSILPVPVSVMNPVAAAPTTAFNLLDQRFVLVVDANGVLKSLNSFAPVQGFSLFLQGAEVDPGTSLMNLVIPPGGFLEVVARKHSTN